MLKFCFVHLFKNGGTSIKQMLSNRFGNQFYPACNISEASFLSRCEFNQIYRSRYTYYSDHRASLCCTEGLDVKTLVVTRNPVDRFISFYNYANTISPFFENDIVGAIYDTYIKKNIPHKIMNQNFHLSEGLGFDYIKQRSLENVTIVPMDYINDIPKLFGFSHDLHMLNASTYKNISKDIKNEILKYCYDDLYLYEWSLEEYTKNRDKILSEVRFND